MAAKKKPTAEQRPPLAGPPDADERGVSYCEHHAPCGRDRWAGMLADMPPATAAAIGLCSQHSEAWRAARGRLP